MDRKPYYRLLGLTEGATAAQIKDAYEKKMHKLRSDDYADDPEYVARKTREVRHAYSVLTGSAAPATRAQKEARFEKWKDAQDEGEDAIREAKKAFRTGASKLKAFGHDTVCDLDEEAEEKGSRVFRRAEAMDEETGAFRSAGGSGRTGSGSRKKTYYAPHEHGAKKEGQNQLRNKIIAVAVVLFLGSGILSTCTELVTDAGNSLSYIISEPEYEASSEETWEQVKQIQENADQFDFESFLDFSDCEDYADQVEWELGEETAAFIWNDMTDLAWYLHFSSNNEAISYITGDEEFYWENDDITNALTMASVMNPPAFEEVAGAVNLYTGERILNYSDYLIFLQNVAEDQIDLVAPVDQ